jgi:hypothetical protein
VRFDRRQVHKDLTLVVDRAAAVDLPVANRADERRRRPEFLGIGRLHVVVTVDEDRRRALGVQPRPVSDGQAVRFEHLGLGEPSLLHPRDHGFGRTPHVGMMRGIRRDRRVGDPHLEFVEKPVAIVANPPDQGLCVRSDHGRVFSLARPLPA